MLKKLLIIIAFWLVGCHKESNEYLLGSWTVEEIWQYGIKRKSDKVIQFGSDGKYIFLDAVELHGLWQVKNKILVMYQPEIRDLHGNSSIDAFQQNWTIQITRPYLILEGSEKTGTQSLKLVLIKMEED